MGSSRTSSRYPSPRLNPLGTKEKRKEGEANEECPSTSGSKTPKPTELKIFCIVDGEATAFSVKILSNCSVDELKQAIKAAKKNAFKDIDADQLTLYRVSIPDEDKTVVESEIVSKEALTIASMELWEIFNSELPRKTIHVFVKPPQRGQKRGRDNFEVDEGDETSSKRPKVEEDNLIKAIRAAGLSEKAIVDGRANLPRLTSKELVSVLENIGSRTSEANIFQAISRTASRLKRSSFGKADYVISSPPGTRLPVIDAQDLYVRKEFKDLYDLITKQFCNAEDDARNRIVVTGTA
ncbi:hypothetical protein BX616_007140, partial [Lobosporangium transversale]